jgi:hypothetical protein
VRASRWEILGAWLHLWTPPRDVEIPPVPWRSVALLGLGVVVAVAAIIVFVAPALDSAKQRDAAAEQRRLDAYRRAERARLRFDQRAQYARAVPVARLYRAGRVSAARDELLRDAQASVAGDARARAASVALPAACKA